MLMPPRCRVDKSICIYERTSFSLSTDNIYIHIDKTTKAIEISTVAFAGGEYKRHETIESTTVVGSVVLKTNESEVIYIDTQLLISSLSTVSSGESKLGQNRTKVTRRRPRCLRVCTISFRLVERRCEIEI